MAFIGKEMLKLIFLLFYSMLCFSFLRASSVNASFFGWTGYDDTQALYDAFTANVDTVYIDKQAGDWVSGPLIFDASVNNKVIIFERGVKLRALTGAFDTYLYNGLFTFINCSNVSLQGYGATLQMNKQEYIDLNDGSEWRHVMALSGCNNFEISGFEILDSGGDGIEVSGIWQQAIPSSNIHIKDCLIDNNYRQGISITSANNVLIEHCKITNTSGTPPAYGIDLEPDNTYDEISNIVIRNCRITGNEGGGILISLWQLDETSNPVSVDVSDCYIGSNQNKGIVIDVNSSGPVQGHVNFEKCIIENQPGNGIFSDKRESLALGFSDIVISNVGTNAGDYDMPIFIQLQYDYSGFPLGNITFDNIFIDDRLFSRDFLNISHWGLSSQVENINGNFSIYNPNGASYYIEPPLNNVNVLYEMLPSLPLGDVNISTDDDAAFETGTDTTATFTVSRTSSDISFPLGIYFDVTGTADNRLDYHYFPKALVIPANSVETTYPVKAIKDELAEPVETIDITILSDIHYTVLNGSTQLFIGDNPLKLTEAEIDKYGIYPNPVGNFLSIPNADSGLISIEIYNAAGQLIGTFCSLENNKLDVSFLKPGIYFLELKLVLGLIILKFIKE